MRQSLLSSHNGILRIYILDPEPSTVEVRLCPPQADLEWLTTHLDNICIDEFRTSPSSDCADRVFCGRWERPTTARSRRRYLSQRLLSTSGEGLRLFRRTVAVRKSVIGQTSLKTPTFFFLLPLELRLQIYRHLLITRAVIPLYLDAGHHFRLLNACRSRRYGPGGLWPEILATCSRIREEGTPVLYGSNKFEAGLYWPTKYYERSCRALCPWPRSLSAPLTYTNRQFISKVRISGRYDLWLDSDRELRVLRDFPSLRDLEMQVIFDGKSPLYQEAVWLQAMNSASRKWPALRRLNSYLSVALDDQDYISWYSGRTVDFSVCKTKKAHFARLLAAEGLLFHGRQVLWSLNLYIPRDVGSTCSVEITIYDKRAASQKEEIEYLVFIEGDRKRVTPEWQFPGP